MDRIEKVKKEIVEAEKAYAHLLDVEQPLKSLMMEQVDITPIVQPIPEPENEE